MSEWMPVDDSVLDGPPVERAGADVLGLSETLPFHKLGWQTFESLQRRMMRDVLGLRDPRQYGNRGQRQMGIDLIGRAVDGTETALQSKDYGQTPFTAATLRGAVQELQKHVRPFPVNHFIVCVSRPIHDRNVIDELKRLKAEFQPNELDLWDAVKLSDLLRPHPDIVLTYFTEETTRRFCGEFTVRSRVVPDVDAVLFRDAVTISPEKLTGAQPLIDDAETTDDPATAIALIENAQTKLRAAGFNAHAARHEPARGKLLAKVGREREAARHILDDVWSALDHGRTGNAQSIFDRLRSLASELPDPATVGDYQRVGTAAFELYFNPLGHFPEPSSLLLGDPEDQARLLLLAGETALALGNLDWIRASVPVLLQAEAAPSTSEVHRVRLRLLVADATNEWEQLLLDARRRRLSSDLTPLIAARYARSRALREQVTEAAEHWEEAAALGALARQWDEAATWILSKRTYLTHWGSFGQTDLITLEVAFGEQDYPAPPVIPRSPHALQSALESLRIHRLRDAAISAQRAVRDAVTAGDWSGEQRARTTLAAVLQESEEPERAAAHLARASATAELKDLAAAYPNRFIDVVDELDAPNHWTVGTAYRLISMQADLVPDEQVNGIIGRVLADLDAARVGSLRDVTFFASSRFNNAIKTLAGLSRRLSHAQAEQVLSFFVDQPDVEHGHYRFHDEHEAISVAGIARTYPDLAPRAVRHLVPLMARSQVARKNTTLEVLGLYPEVATLALRDVDGPDTGWAAEMLAFADPTDVAPELAERALDALTTPLQHVPHIHTVGTNVIGDSLLVAGQSPDQIVSVIREQMRRADDPAISDFDRGEYLSAAINLSIDLDEPSKSHLFDEAARLSREATVSDWEALDRQFSHPLSAVRASLGGPDSRGRGRSSQASWPQPMSSAPRSAASSTTCWTTSTMCSPPRHFEISASSRKMTSLSSPGRGGGCGASRPPSGRHTAAPHTSATGLPPTQTSECERRWRGPWRTALNIRPPRPSAPNWQKIPRSGCDRP